MKKPTLKMLTACRSVRQIVALLTKFKVKGMAGDCERCPIANFVLKCGVKNPLVNGEGEIVSVTPNPSPRYGSDYETVLGPAKLREKFIAAFDGGEFKNLKSRGRYA